MIQTYHWGEAFQTQILALLLRYPDQANHLIRPEFFTNPICARIAGFLKHVFDEKIDSQISKPTLVEVLRPSVKNDADWKIYRAYIKKIYSIPLGDKDVIIQQAKAFFKEQAFRQALIRAEKDVSNHRYDAAVKRISDLKNIDQLEKDLGITYWSGIGSPERYTSDRYGIVPTGVRKLDRLLGGGLGAGELGMILAGGKVGKTTLLANFAVGALRYSHTVALATGETSAKKYQKRIDSCITGIPGDQLLKLNKEAQKKLEFQRRLLKGNLYIRQWPTYKGTSSDIEDWVKDIEDATGRPVGLLIVDYIFVFRPASRSDERRMNIGQLGVELRGIVSEHNLPVWSAMQTNRPALKAEKLQANDIAEDISLFWTLDVLLALCQTKAEKERTPERARLYLAEARDVQSGGVVDLKVHRDIQRVVEVAKGTVHKEETEWT